MSDMLSDEEHDKMEKMLNSNRPKLIILEGPDGVGKSTIAKRLANDYSTFIHQPSGDNIVGFLRPECKENPVHSPFERQLLHTISHTIDVYEELDKGGLNFFVMDRCFISGYVYGGLMGLNQDQLDLLFKINNEIHLNTCRDMEVHIIFMDRSEPFVQNNDLYENELKWSDIRKMYLDFHMLLGETGQSIISNKTKIDLINIDGATEDEVFNHVIELVENKEV